MICHNFILKSDWERENFLEKLWHLNKTLVLWICWSEKKHFVCPHLLFASKEKPGWPPRGGKRPCCIQSQNIEKAATGKRVLTVPPKERLGPNKSISERPSETQGHVPWTRRPKSAAHLVDRSVPAAGTNQCFHNIRPHKASINTDSIFF